MTMHRARAVSAPSAVAPSGRVRRFGLVALVVVGVLVNVPAARAVDRLDRVVAGLGRSPLFVDPDVGTVLPAPDRPGLESALRGAGVPVYVVAIPFISADESAGSESRFLDLLHARFGRPGEYVVVDEHGALDDATYDVDRRIELPSPLFDESFKRDRPVAQRLAAFIDLIRQAPPGSTSDSRYHDPPDPVRRRNRSGTPPVRQMLGNAALGVFVVGPVLGLLVYFPLVRGVARFRPRT
jgi:hypothetical protein